MEYRSVYFAPEVDFLHSWANFQADRLLRVMTLINTNVVLLPVAVRHSKTPELNLNFIRGNENVTHSTQGQTAFWGEFSV